MHSFNLIREIRELKTQLAYCRNIGFFFGAGTSCALGLPDVTQLTIDVERVLTGEHLKCFKRVKTDLKDIPSDRDKNIEDVLNQVRSIRELTGGLAGKEYQGVSGNQAKELDLAICRAIYSILHDKEEAAEIVATQKFFAWLNIHNQHYSKEIFTTNYDVLLERSLEATEIPYFDGFVGSYEPFFLPASIDTFVAESDLTQHWVRLWKMHGSLSWFWKKDTGGKSHRIIRMGKLTSVDAEAGELVIYPSKDKYDSSRKQPFIAYFDRLKNYLLSGERLFIFTGYSFCDQHINEVFFSCLRQNNRLSAFVFLFKDEEVRRFHELSSSVLNVSAFGPSTAVINGEIGQWQFKKDDLKPSEESSDYWDEAKEQLTIGDYKSLVAFFVTNSGRADRVEATVNGE